MVYEFYWMHKNEKCTKIKANTKTEEIEIENYKEDPLFCAFGVDEEPDYKKLMKLLRSRYQPARRSDTAEKWQKLGVNVQYPHVDIIKMTRGMLIEDFFWFKGVSESDKVTFESMREMLSMSYKGGFVSLDTLRKHTFTYNEMNGVSSLCTTASQKKWVYKGWLIKEDSYGYEALSEIVASILIRHIKEVTSIDYVLLNPIGANGVCASVLTTDNTDTEYVTYWNIIEKYGIEDNLSRVDSNDGYGLLQYIIKVVSNIVGEDAADEIKYRLMLDALLMNIDRHFNNMALGRKSDGTYFHMPNYDHGLSFLTTGCENATSRLYGGTFERYIELAGEDHKLHINISELLSDLRILKVSLRNNIFYYKMFIEIESYICDRLVDTKGIIWEPIGDKAYKIQHHTDFLEQLFEKELGNVPLNAEYQEYICSLHNIEHVDSGEMDKTVSLEDMQFGNHHTGE